MALLDCMDAIQVHALAAAGTAATASGVANFTDVAVRFPQARGRCVCIFYGGEREPTYFGEQTLTTQLMSDVVVVRAYWPVSEYAAKRDRLLEGEMASFAASLRTRLVGDFTLGGNCTALRMEPGSAEQVLVAGSKYSLMDWEIFIDFREYTYAP